MLNYSINAFHFINIAIIYRSLLRPLIMNSKDYKNIFFHFPYYPTLYFTNNYFLTNRCTIHYHRLLLSIHVDIDVQNKIFIFRFSLIFRIKLTQ